MTGRVILQLQPLFLFQIKGKVEHVIIGSDVFTFQPGVFSINGRGHIQDFLSPSVHRRNIKNLIRLRANGCRDIQDVSLLIRCTADLKKARQRHRL
jgi:hypothetical protein